VFYDLAGRETYPNHGVRSNERCPSALKAILFLVLLGKLWEHGEKIIRNWLKKKR